MKPELIGLHLKVDKALTVDGVREMEAALGILPLHQDRVRSVAKILLGAAKAVGKSGAEWTIDKTVKVELSAKQVDLSSDKKTTLAIVRSYHDMTSVSAAGSVRSDVVGKIVLYNPIRRNINGRVTVDEGSSRTQILLAKPESLPSILPKEWEYIQGYANRILEEAQERREGLIPEMTARGIIVDTLATLHFIPAQDNGKIPRVAPAVFRDEINEKLALLNEWGLVGRTFDIAGAPWIAQEGAEGPLQTLEKSIAGTLRKSPSLAAAKRWAVLKETHDELDKIAGIATARPWLNQAQEAALKELTGGNK